MSSKDKRKLAEYYLDFRKKQYSEIFKKKLSIKKQKEIKDFIIKYIKDDDKYLSLISDEGNNISFIIADKGEDDGEDAIVCVTCPPKVVPSVKLVFVENERNRAYDT